ncbi:hypothetical protein PHISP_06074 [Aspergillus sp. HF37]|nr:hypothetical protein PHISP_06074 [Aspergillus sp. HF37]
MADRETLEPPDNSNGSNVASPRSSTDSRSPSLRNHSRHRSFASNHQHRQSFSESLRGAPGSPRAHRPPSLTQSAIQSLIDNPPARNHANPAFAGRDWRQISVGELVSADDLKFVDLDTGIEEATNTLIDTGAAVLLIREHPQSASAVGTFDYSDLNAYLLLAAGLTQPDEEHLPSFEQLARKAREGIKIPLRDVKDLGTKNALTNLPASASVLKAVETFGGGLHRVVVVDESKNNEAVGIFSQFRLVKFLWENGRSFPVIDQLYPQYLKDLTIGSQEVISINGDKALCEALQLMNGEGITSLAVVDNQFNVVGNISTADVKLLTRSSSLHLLHNTFFHVNPTSTLAHTVAKVVATKSHRLWVTDPHSPSSSGPPTPSHSTVYIPQPTVAGQSSANQGTNASESRSSSPPVNASNPQANYTTPHLPSPPQSYANTMPHCHAVPSPGLAPSVPASALPGARLSGRLVGVVSLTDILNLHARASGLNPADPAESRSRRRRSSSSSVSIRRSGDVAQVLGGRGGFYA